MLPLHRLCSELVWKAPALKECLLHGDGCIGVARLMGSAATSLGISYPDAFGSLDKDQLRAAECTARDILTEAGPGSGKTRVMAARVAWLLLQGVRPNNILAMTFTRKAKAELEKRFEASGSRDVQAYTFHGLCFSIISNHLGRLNGDLQANFGLMNDRDCQHLLHEVMMAMPEVQQWSEQGGNVMKLARWLHNDVIHMAKETEDTTYMRSDMGQLLFKHVRELKAKADRRTQSTCNFLAPAVLEKIFQAYQSAMRDLNAIEYSDFLGLAVYLLKTYPDIRAKYEDRYKHILVDEFQDTNKPQYALVKLIKGAQNTLSAYGDADQAIYAWRGAKPSIMTKTVFDDIPNLQKLPLKNNYRHPRQLVNRAQLIKKVARLPGAHKDIVPMRAEKDGALKPIVRTVRVKDENDEANAVAEILQQGFHESRYKPTEVAVLCRFRKAVSAISEVLQKRGIPVQPQQDEVNWGVVGLKAYLQLLEDPLNRLAIKRIIDNTGRKVGIADIHQLHLTAQASGFDNWAKLLWHGLDQVLLTADQVKQVMTSTCRGQLLKDLLTGRGVAGINGVLQGALALPLTVQQQLDDFRYMYVLLHSVAHHGSMKDVLDAILDTELGGYSHSLRRDAGARKTIEKLRKRVALASSSNAGLILTSQTCGQGQGSEHGATMIDGHSNIKALLGLCEAEERPAGGVSVMTMHKSKGLEFTAVICAGWDDGLQRIWNADIAEEYRLAYVAATRAQRDLVLISTENRNGFGGPRAPSKLFQAMQDAGEI